LPNALRGPANFDGTELDRAALLERLRALHRSRTLRHLNGRPSPLILEIGAGYGALALALKTTLPRVTYVIIDLPDSLALSGCYLASRQSAPVMVANGEPLLPGSFVLCPATALERLPALSIDLAINTLSFAEMTEAEVERYARFLVPRLGHGGTLFEQNYDNTELGPAFCNPRKLLARYFSVQRRVRGLYLRGVPRVWFLSADQRLAVSHR
jgi:putative sugar O-methyltransferase